MTGIVISACPSLRRIGALELAQPLFRIFLKVHAMLYVVQRTSNGYLMTQCPIAKGQDMKSAHLCCEAGSTDLSLCLLLVVPVNDQEADQVG